MAGLRATSILAGFLLLTVAGLPVQWLALKVSPGFARRFPVWYHRQLRRLMGMRVRVIGTPVAGGVLMTANHSGWLDITILSSLHPVSFVAKSEVRSWPLFGLLARLQRTLFVHRAARTRAAADRDAIRARLEAGEALVIFPEGTSSDGNRVLPFKSTLLGAAEIGLGDDRDRPVHPPVQPVSIAYVGLYGLPMGRENRPYFAWYGDMELVPHLWEAFARGPIDVVVEFHAPLSVDTFGGRKALAAAAENAVRAGLVRALHGGDAVLGSADETLLVPAEDGEETEEAAA